MEAGAGGLRGLSGRLGTRMCSKPVVLTTVGHYLPGFRFGGPVRSLANMVELLGEEFSFRIVTSDRDLGDQLPYPDIQIGNWTCVRGAQVCYLPRDPMRLLRAFRDLLRETPHDLF